MENKLTESVIFKNLDPKMIAQIIVNKNKDSDTIKEMESADKYYSGHNEYIENKSRVYYDKDGKSHENPNASNKKIKSEFLRMLVQQKQDYGFAKTFILKISDENEQEIELSENEYGKAWSDFIKKKLFKFAYILAGQSVNHGIGWAYVWINEDGELELKDVSAINIYPAWKDQRHNELDRIIYHYTIEEYKSLNPDLVEYAEYWSPEERILFNVSDDWKEQAIITDEENNPIHAHMMNADEQVNWGRIPFIPFKATDDERTMLSFIKEYIDSYDELSSKSVDGLIDDLDPLLVFKGITPEVGSLIEAREIAKMTRTISLDTDGDAHFIQAETPIQSHLTEKQSLRSDIIRFGCGVDYEDARFNGNPNQMVIKSLYQNLDTYTDGLERQFQTFIDNLKYFFDKWCEWTGKGSFEENQKYKVLIKLDRSMMINQSSQIEDCVKLLNTGVSKKTQLEFNPVVQDVELELERIEEEQKKMQNNDLFNFAHITNTENGEEYDTPENEEEGNE